MALHIYFDGEPCTWLNIALANLTHCYTVILHICLLPLQTICSQMVKIKLGNNKHFLIKLIYCSLDTVHKIYSTEHVLSKSTYNSYTTLCFRSFVSLGLC